MTALALIVILGAAAQWVAHRLSIPSILPLLAAGFLLGPEVAGWVRPDELFGSLLFPFVSLSVAILLFEGGLSLHARELKQQGGVVLRLVTVGAAVTWVLATLGARTLLGLEWRIAILFGALLTVTGPTVVLPILRQVRPTGTVGAILKWEGILIDPIGAVLAVLVLEGILGATAGDTVLGIVVTILIGGGIGLVLGWLLAFLLHRFWLPDHLHNPVALAFIFGGFALANHVQHEAGLLTATVMGIYLANQKRASVHHILEFKENIRVLLISALFILLTARVRLADFGGIDPGGAVAFLAALILVVRPASVLASARGVARNERLFMSAMAPRGIVAASVASLFAIRLNDPSLVPLTFMVIVATVLVYGLGAGPLARGLGLAEANPQGVLVLGAQEWARALAATLQECGIRVALVDVNPHNVRQARMDGIETYRLNLLSDEADKRVDLAGLGRLLCLTPNDEVNVLAALRYAGLFGRREVYHLVPRKGGEVSAHLRGRLLFGEDLTYGALSARFGQGARFKATLLTEQFGYAEWRARYGEATPLASIDAKGTLLFATVSYPLEPEPGDTLIALVDPAAA